MASNSQPHSSCQNQSNAADSEANEQEEEEEEIVEEIPAVVHELANKINNTFIEDSDEESDNNSNQNNLNHNQNRPLVGAVTGVPNRSIPPPEARVNDNPAPLPPPQRPRLGAINPYYNWQAMKPTVRERFQYLHNNETLADVHFVVGRGRQAQRIPAHKLILSAGSVVFDAMFNSVLASQSDDIELPDVESAAFLSLLRFLYTDEVQIGPEIVMTTLYTAKKYAVPALESHCVDFLKKNLGPHNAFMLLTQARLFDEPQLAALCLDCIDHNTSEAFNADGFTDIDFETLLNVMKRDSLDIRECKLFSAVLRWASAECARQDLEPTNENKRQVLGHAVNLIRFPLMTIEEFAQGPAQSGLLVEREVVELFLYFTLNPKPRIPYSEVVRHGVKSKEQRTISRFYEVAQRWGYSGSSDRIKFKVDRKIMIAGLGLYGAIQGPADYQVKMQIICCDSGDVLSHNDTGFTCDGSSKPFRVMFKDPVEIIPDVMHTISATLIGPDSYYGSRGHRKVSHDCVQSGKTTFSFAFAAGTNNGTSVDDGQIPEIIFTA